MSDPFPTFQPVFVRYDGLDAEKHEIDLFEFGKSAQGLAKIIATVADFSITGNYQDDKRNLCCKITIKEPKANCFSFMAIIHHIDKSPTLTTFAGVSGASIFVGILAFVWSIIAGKKEEMKALKESLNTAIVQLGRRDDSQRLIEAVEKMALALVPAAKQAVAPIGVSCETMKFGDGKEYHTTLNEDDRDVIYGEIFDVSDEEEYRVLISEFDMKNRTCKISLKDDLMRRFSAKVTDPQAELANNKYVSAMNSKSIVTIKAKTKMVGDKIREFVVSDMK